MGFCVSKLLQFFSVIKKTTLNMTYHKPWSNVALFKWGGLTFNGVSGLVKALRKRSSLF